MEKRVKDLVVHKASKYIPELSDQEYAELKGDIDQFGLKVPVEVIGNIVLDGRHRLRAAKALGFKNIPAKEVTLRNGETEAAYVLKAAVLRRHLTDEQRRMISAMYAKENPRPKGGDTRSEAAKTKPHPVGGERKSHKQSTAQLDAARLFNVPPKGVEKAMYVLNNAPKLAKKVHRGEMTISEAQRQIKKKEIKKRVAMLPEGKYRVFYADPPWKYSSSGPGIDNYGPAERHYPAMSIDELCSLDIKSLVADDAVLFLWVTAPMLEDSFRVIQAWGFKYKTQAIWYKVKHNYGHYFSVRHENLLVCTRGSCTPDSSKLPESVQTIERSSRHSEKPEEFRKIIDTLYPHGRRIELFARKKVKGWEAYGNELEETPVLAGNGR